MRPLAGPGADAKQFRFTLVRCLRLPRVVGCYTQGTCDNECSTKSTDAVVRKFHAAYVGRAEIERVDAFFSNQMANFEHCSLIVSAPTRYEDQRFNTAPWAAMNANLEALARAGRRHTLAKNTRYDTEYVRYFASLALDYVPNFCAYTGLSYAPTRDAFLLLALLRGLDGPLARLWDEQFAREYTRLSPKFADRQAAELTVRGAGRRPRALSDVHCDNLRAE